MKKYPSFFRAQARDFEVLHSRHNDNKSSRLRTWNQQMFAIRSTICQKTVSTNRLMHTNKHTWGWCPRMWSSQWPYGHTESQRGALRASARVHQYGKTDAKWEWQKVSTPSLPATNWASQLSTPSASLVWPLSYFLYTCLWMPAYNVRSFLCFSIYMFHT